MEHLLSIDKQLLLFINKGLSNPALDFVMMTLSSRVTWVIVFASLFAFFCIRKNWRCVFLMLFIGVLVIIIDQISYGILKPYFERLRPCKQFKREVHRVLGCAGKFGFPSNHAANGMAVVVGFFVFGTRPLAMTALILALLVGFSRIYLGVHYPSDILGGFIYGGLCAIAACLPLRKSRFFASS